MSCMGVPVWPPIIPDIGPWPIVPDMGLPPVMSDMGPPPIVPEMVPLPIIPDIGPWPIVPYMGLPPVMSDMGPPPIMLDMGLPPIMPHIPCIIAAHCTWVIVELGTTGLGWSCSWANSGPAPRTNNARPRTTVKTPGFQTLFIERPQSEISARALE